MFCGSSLPSLQIGSLRVGFPVVQAALSGYSDWPMRVIARRLGAPYTLCEVMLDQFLLSLKKRKKTGHLVHTSDEEHPVGGQLMGAESEQFSAGALKLVQAGFDVIDINFGCPVKKVLGRCRGGFHLSQPAAALAIIRRTRDVVPPQIPVTVKMRRGIDERAESADQFWQILEGAFQAGVAAVTVHGRTVAQRYEGASDWRFLAEVKRQFPQQTILGSGDLFSAEDCLQMMDQAKLDGVTAARGAIGNPWVFAQARALAEGRPLPSPPGLYEQRQVILEHYRLAEQLYGPRRCTQIMRKFGIRYAALHPEYEQVRNSYAAARNRAEWENVLATWYDRDGPGQHPPRAIHQVQ